MHQFEKIFVTTVDIADVIDFCADKRRHLLTALRNKFVGRCFSGAYILSVKDILKTSSCHISRSNYDAEGYVDVQFLAHVAVFSRWDVLTGVDVVNHQHMLVGTYEQVPVRNDLLAAAGDAADAAGDAADAAGDDADAAGDAGAGAAPEAPAKRRAAPAARAAPARAVKARAVVSILASKVIETIALGQKISVRVVGATHSPMHTQASVIGALLVCDQVAPAYKLRGSLDQNASAELAPMLAAVEKELKLRELLVAARQGDVWYFEMLLYSFRGGSVAGADNVQSVNAWEGGPVWKGPRSLQDVEDGTVAVSALDVIRRAVSGESVPVTGVWSRSLALYRSSPLVALARSNAVPETWVVVDSAPRVAFAEFLKNILDFLVATRELVSVYSTRELLDRHSNIWSIMRAAQKPAAVR